MRFLVLNNKYAIYKFRSLTEIPDRLSSSDFHSVTRTKDEVSVVAPENDSLNDDVVCSKGWRIIKVAGPLDLSLTGIIAEISCILSGKKIPIFTISTYDTDYVLVREADVESAVQALKEEGHAVTKE